MSPSASLPPLTRPPAALGVLALHGALLVLLLQAETVRQVLPEVLPVSVSLLAAAELAPAPPPARPLPVPVRPAAPTMPMLLPPALDVRVPTVPASTPAPEPAPALAAAPAVVVAVAVAAPAPSLPPPAPAEPRQMPPGAISYRVPPAIAVPLASRRLRESGTVWLRVHVDRQGLPVQISVHKTSGHPRLDEQALAAMQAARFVPQTESGTPIDWIVIAPLAYDID